MKHFASICICVFLCSCVGVITPRSRTYVPANFAKLKVSDTPKGVEVELVDVDMEKVTRARWEGVRQTLRELSQGGAAARLIGQ